MAEGYWTYKILIDPLTSWIRSGIIKMIEPGSSILDVACGTGSLVFALSSNVKSAVGIDLEGEKIKLANKLVAKKKIENVRFIEADATSLNGLFTETFDYVILSLAVHQFPEPLRSEILEQARKVAKRVIIADYAVPVPKNISGYASHGIEKLAGDEHYSAYKHFVETGGIPGIVDRMDFTIQEEATSGTGVFKVVKM